MRTSGAVDWLSVTFKGEVTLERVLPRKIGESYWALESGGLNGYKTRHTNEKTGVVGLSDGNIDMGVHTIANGANLAQIRALGIPDREYISYVIDNAGKVARVDLALDIHDGKMSVTDYANAYEDKRLTTKALSATRWHSMGEPGETLYLGKRTSNRMARIYDKAAEQKVSGQWIRIELECKAEYARAVALAIKQSGTRDTINRALLDFIDFPSCGEYIEATRQADSQIAAIEKPISNTYRWLLEIAAPSLARYALDNPQEDVLTAFSAVVNEFLSPELTSIQNRFKIVK